MSDHTLAYQIASEIMNTIEREARINRDDLILAVERTMQVRETARTSREHGKASDDIVEHLRREADKQANMQLSAGVETAHLLGWAADAIERLRTSGSNATGTSRGWLEAEMAMLKEQAEAMDRIVNPPAFITAGHTISAEELRAYRYTGKRTSE